MTREPTAYGRCLHGFKNRSVVTRRMRPAILALTGLGIAGTFAASFGADHQRHASEGAGSLQAGVGQPVRVASSLDTLQRLPEAVRVSLQATQKRSSKDLCRIAERLVREPAVTSIDAIALYLSKDVHRWSDRMITLYLDTDPKLAKGADKGDMKARLLHKWESDRGLVQRWLQGCGVVARATIGRGRIIIEREAPEILADVVSAIAIGIGKNEPDAIAAAEALRRAEEGLRASLR